MNDEQLWAAYIKETPSDANAKYEAWSYGSDIPDELLALTLSGKKTATASAYPIYVFEECDIPKVGDLSIILNTAQEAKCIIKNTCVTVVPFNEVSEQHAFKEGEGDRSLKFWRDVHRKFFTLEMADINAKFSEDMPVVCEEFEVVFTA